MQLIHHNDILIRISFQKVHTLNEFLLNFDNETYDDMTHSMTHCILYIYIWYDTEGEKYFILWNQFLEEYNMVMT